MSGGTSISATIDSPAEDTVFPQGPVKVTGTAAVGAAVPVKDTALTYVVDVFRQHGGPPATTHI